MPTASLFSPVHPTSAAFLFETYAHLCRQTVTSWQWVLLENNAEWPLVPEVIRADKRVKVVQGENHRRIGAHKRKACEACDGDVLIELDADDILHPEAVAKVLKAVEAGAEFVYSDCVSFRQQVQGAPWEASWDLPNGALAYPYSEVYGWEHYATRFHDVDLIAMRAPPATAHNLRRIEWSPDHLRAWTKKAYLEVGGHNPEMAVADDHELMVRFYLAGKRFVHIPEPLYLYRVHGQNTVITANAAIQKATDEVYTRYVDQLAIAWAKRAGLRLIDLCGGIDPAPGFTPIDRHVQSGIAANLDQDWPLEDNSVGVLRAHDALEHLSDPIHTMNEAYRVLAPGGWFLINVPSTTGKGAFCDPTHRSYWNDLSFRYYTNERFARYIPAFRGRFQVARVREFFPSQQHILDNVPYIGAQLIALKDGFAPMGEVLI